MGRRDTVGNAVHTGYKHSPHHISGHIHKNESSWLHEKVGHLSDLRGKSEISQQTDCEMEPRAAAGS